MNQITKPKGQAALSTPVNDDDLIRILGASVWPNAKPESVALALGYCRAAGLDPMMKVVHIMPMWDSEARVKRDVIMPGIDLYRFKAADTGEYIGMSEAEYGPDVTAKLGETTITYPEWCKITVYRAVGVHRAEFTAKEYWLENYATAKRDVRDPNSMWSKRPKAQLAKCAEAQALRRAFPDTIGGAATAEEMEGKELAAEMRDVTPEAAEEKKTKAKSDARAQLDSFANVKKPKDEPPHDALTGEILPPEGEDGSIPQMPAAAAEALASGKWAKGWKWFQTTLPTIAQQGRPAFWGQHAAMLKMVAAYNADAKAAVAALAQQAGVKLDDHEAG